ncbi:hypothetical protein ASV02_23795 [Enterobacter hormaechei subsp. xiangfangensis]|nr:MULTISPECIES: DUF6453 family protein [Enterobacter]KTI51504.1 hypothetical protein ASV02_23795 [Enterobacter hormaechei subsp. xiangfangensis]KVJ13130.1 hypothetical protein AWS39_23260 [Enterobacter hormaechei subsp. xiangfangensis]KVJ18704.1 hypothetical protein AWS38_08085 [Enterobacter hormaechei subsp. xiangfangensis]KVJ20471.1 hypothetical protein AWS37_00010 [Enterobacter hormaechei subsp. xiangfangensis]KVJ29081.1 hypothetical protein AWS36_00175 [Enterobacter hormaechei subsp. xian
MPRGLLIDLNDGGKRMEITAGLRCPSFGAYFDSGYQKAKYADIAGYVSGAQVLFIPHATAYLDSGLLHKMNSATISGGRVTQNSTMKDVSISERESTYTFPGSIWQIFPPGQRKGEGLLIDDSTDFLAITNATQSGQCIWKGTVNVPTGGWAVPTIAGYDKSKYIVFGRCNSGNTVDFDGNTVRFFSPPSTNDDAPTTGTIDIVIFASGVTPQPGTGLNIFNAAGACTFSTTKRPFVYLNQLWTPSKNAVSIGSGYVPLGRFGLMAHEVNGMYVYRMFGIKIQNGSASVQGGKYLGRERYAIFGNDTVTPLNLPVLPDMYV